MERGLSQEDVALKAGITPAYLGQVERGLKNPTVLIVERICTALNISLAAFFSTAAPPMPTNDGVEKQILGQIGLLTAEEKNIVLQAVRNMMQLRVIAIRNVED